MARFGQAKLYYCDRFEIYNKTKKNLLTNLKFKKKKKSFRFYNLAEINGRLLEDVRTFSFKW